MVQLDNGVSYQAGEFLETCKDCLVNGCKIIIEKCRVDSSKRKYVVCKIVEKGDWSGYMDYKSVPMLSPKNKDAKVVLDVKTVTHNSQKRKLVLLEDGTVYKIKKSKLEDHVSPGIILP